MCFQWFDSFKRGHLPFMNTLPVQQQSRKSALHLKLSSNKISIIWLIICCFGNFIWCIKFPIAKACSWFLRNTAGVICQPSWAVFLLFSTRAFSFFNHLLTLQLSLMQGCWPAIVLLPIIHWSYGSSSCMWIQEKMQLVVIFSIWSLIRIVHPFSIAYPFE